MENKVLSILGWAFVLMLIGACEGRYKTADIDRIAMQAAVTRATGTGAIVSSVTAGEIPWSDFVDAAFAKIEAGIAASAANSKTPAAGAKALIDAALFAGSVLDAGKQMESLPNAEELIGSTGSEHEFGWWRVGRLAFQASEQLGAAGKGADARATVLAGPSRWQDEAYWRKYPDHDALAAVILAQSGEKDEALRRLRSRPALNPPADEVLQALEGGR